MKNPFRFISTLHKFSQMSAKIEELDMRLQDIEGELEKTFQQLVWWKHKALTFMDMHKNGRP